MNAVKAYKLKCAQLTNAKRERLYLMCTEYASIYNYASRFLPSLPEWYFERTNPSKLYTKYIKSGLIIREHIQSQDAFNALKDAATNYKSAISNNNKSRKGLKIQEMKPNVIKFENGRYTIVKNNDTYGIIIGKKDSIYIPLVLGMFDDAKLCLDSAIDTGINPGVILYNFRDNTVSIPHKTCSDHKLIKKGELITYIGVDLGINNSMVMSAIQYDNKEPVVKQIEIYSARHLNNRLRQLTKRNNILKSHNKPIDDTVRNIKDTTSHQMSKAIVDFATQFESPVVFFEDLKSMKKKRMRVKSGGKEGKHMRRMISAWNYAELITKTEYKLKSEGIWIMKLNPMYTSQKCSQCGTFGTRTGSVFHCETCGFGCGSSPQGTVGQYNADVNASINIALLGLFVLYGRKGGRVAWPKCQPYENIVNPIPTDMTGIEGTTPVKAGSLKKQASACS